MTPSAAQNTWEGLRACAQKLLEVIEGIEPALMQTEGLARKDSEDEAIYCDLLRLDGLLQGAVDKLTQIMEAVERAREY